MIYIGIDPGVHTGMAVWDSVKREFISLDTLSIHRAMERVKRMYDSLQDDDAGDMKVIYEDAHLRKWFGSNSRAKVQGAGSIKRDCTIWEDFLSDYGIPHEGIHPLKGGTKWTPELFQKVTGWKGRTSGHSRDAGMMVYGR